MKSILKEGLLMNTWICFFLGIFIGSVLGVFICALAVAAKHGDE
jgi:hypothetical protein